MFGCTQPKEERGREKERENINDFEAEKNNLQ